MNANSRSAHHLIVPDEVTIGLVRERFAEPDTAQGFMLDGFPRTVPQAEALAEALSADSVNLDVVLLLEVPDELIVERIIGRRTDPETGDIYHLTFNPPPTEITDRLVHRKDDTEDAVRARLEAYHNMTAPIIPFYEAAGLLRRVNGVGTPDAVTEAIQATLN